MVDDLTKYFYYKKVINVEIIHHECCGDKLQKSYKNYRTVKREDYPEKE